MSAIQRVKGLIQQLSLPILFHPSDHENFWDEMNSRGVASMLYYLLIHTACGVAENQIQLFLDPSTDAKRRVPDFGNVDGILLSLLSYYHLLFSHLELKFQHLLNFAFHMALYYDVLPKSYPIKQVMQLWFHKLFCSLSAHMIIF